MSAGESEGCCWNLPESEFSGRLFCSKRRVPACGQPTLCARSSDRIFLLNSHHKLAASASHPSFTEQETETQKGGDWSVVYLVKGRCGFALETPCFQSLHSFHCTYSSSPAGLLILQESASFSLPLRGQDPSSQGWVSAGSHW